MFCRREAARTSPVARRLPALDGHRGKLQEAGQSLCIEKQFPAIGHAFPPELRFAAPESFGNEPCSCTRDLLRKFVRPLGKRSWTPKVIR
jgi:hypothetical protein